MKFPGLFRNFSSFEIIIEQTRKNGTLSWAINNPITLGVENQLMAAKERDWETLLKQSEAFAKASSMRMRLNSISNIYS